MVFTAGSIRLSGTHGGDDLVTQLLPVNEGATWAILPWRFRPDSIGEMPVVSPARDQVPMNVRRHHIAQAREIDLVRLVQGSNRALHGK